MVTFFRSCLSCNQKQQNLKRMKIVKVTYGVKSRFVKENLENVTKFIADLHETNHPGIRYMACLGKDGKTFFHTAIFDGEESQQVLFRLDSFKFFQQKRDESGLEVLPKIEEMDLIASSYPAFDEK